MPGAKLIEESGDEDDSDDDDCATFIPFKGDPELIGEYISAMGADGDNAIRVINDDAAALTWEIVIPPSQLQSGKNRDGGPLKIGVICEAKKEDLPTLQRVNVEEYPWSENVVGEWDSWVEE